MVRPPATDGGPQSSCHVNAEVREEPPFRTSFSGVNWHIYFSRNGGEFVGVDTGAWAPSGRPVLPAVGVYRATVAVAIDVDLRLGVRVGPLSTDEIIVSNRFLGDLFASLDWLQAVSP